MEEKKRCVLFLQLKRALLTDNMTLEGELLNKLLGQNAITRKQFDTVQKCTGTVKEKAGLLLDILEKRPTAHIKTFFILIKEDEAEAGAAEVLETDGFYKSIFGIKFKGRAAIAVFSGCILDHTNAPLERVVAAPLTPQGLGGKYRQVEAIPRVPHPRKWAAVVRYNGQVWLIGGSDEDKLLGVCDVLDLATWQWRQGPSLGTPRQDLTVTEVGMVMVAVGGYASKDLSSVETLVSGSDWQPGPDLPKERRLHAACEWNGRVWVSGGHYNGALARAVLSFCPGEDGWRQEASLTEGRWGHSMASVGWDRMLVCGGEDPFTMEEYNPGSKTWSRLTALPQVMVRSSLIVHGQAVYIVGGNNSTSTLRYDGHWHKEDHDLPWSMVDTVACLIDLPYSQ